MANLRSRGGALRTDRVHPRPSLVRIGKAERRSPPLISASFLMSLPEQLLSAAEPERSVDAAEYGVEVIRWRLHLKSSGKQRLGPIRHFLTWIGKYYHARGQTHQKESSVSCVICCSLVNKVKSVDFCCISDFLCPSSSNLPNGSTSIPPSEEGLPTSPILTDQP